VTKFYISKEFFKNCYPLQCCSPSLEFCVGLAQIDTEKAEKYAKLSEKYAKLGKAAKLRGIVYDI